MMQLFQGETRGGLADYDKAGAIADFRKALEISPGLRTASESLQRLGAAQYGTRAARIRKIFAAGPCNGLSGSYVFRMTYAAEAAASAHIENAVIAAADVCLFSRGGLQCRALVSSTSIARGKTGSACCLAC
jgi:hypothetical protein